MGLLEVDRIGLERLAAACRSWAAEISATSPSAVPPMEWQATVVAVGAAHADVPLAVRAMVARMQETAVGLVTVAGQYTASDDRSAARLRELVIGG